jgi:unconventional prefoldin RPB5 interactor 1
MKALEKRLKNIGPDAEIAGIPLANGPKMEQQPSVNTVSRVVDEKPKSGNKKGVQFASELDIQEAPKPTPHATSQQDSEPKPPKKAASNPVHASVIERPFTALSEDTAETPTEPDEYDRALVQQEVATEYHKMRNRMIQRQGGFMARDDEKAEVPFTEEEGGPKKMSRFKAARLGRA